MFPAFTLFGKAWGSVENRATFKLGETGSTVKKNRFPQLPHQIFHSPPGLVSRWESLAIFRLVSMLMVRSWSHLACPQGEPLEAFANVPRFCDRVIWKDDNQIPDGTFWKAPWNCALDALKENPPGWHLCWFIWHMREPTAWWLVLSGMGYFQEWFLLLRNEEENVLVVSKTFERSPSSEIHRWSKLLTQLFATIVLPQSYNIVSSMESSWCLSTSMLFTLYAYLPSE